MNSKVPGVDTSISILTAEQQEIFQNFSDLHALNAIIMVPMVPPLLPLTFLHFEKNQSFSKFPRKCSCRRKFQNIIQKSVIENKSRVQDRLSIAGWKWRTFIYSNPV